MKKEKRLREGIFIEERTWNDIAALAEELNVEIPV